MKHDYFCTGSTTSGKEFYLELTADNYRDANSKLFDVCAEKGWEIGDFCIVEREEE